MTSDLYSLVPQLFFELLCSCAADSDRRDSQLQHRKRSRLTGPQRWVAIQNRDGLDFPFYNEANCCLMKEDVDSMLLWFASE